jgi:hypothetical protein
MPSALWTYYDSELRTAILTADVACDVSRLTGLLGQSLCFEQLVALIDDRARLDDVCRDNQLLRRRVLELTLAAMANAPPDRRDER